MTLTTKSKLILIILATAAMWPIFVWGVSAWTLAAAFVTLVILGVSAGFFVRMEPPAK